MRKQSAAVTAVPLPRLQDARRAKAAIAANFGAMALRYSEWILDRPLTQGLFEAFVALLEPEMSGRAGATVRRGR